MITLTENAVKHVKRLISEEPSADGAALRIQVVGGGCSGMSYKLGFDKDPPTAQDKIIEQGGVKLIVDSKSMLFIAGTTLDFTDGLNGKGFEFVNPNAKRTCGCGSSFSA